jgi:hypothetical protein
MKLSDDQVSEVLRRWNAEEADQYELAAAFGVSQATISNIVTGKRRVHVKAAGPAPRGLITEAGRECSGPCGLFKPWSEFSPNPNARLTRRQSACKDCRNDRRALVVAADPAAHRLAARRDYIWRKYGITLEQYAWLSEQQGHQCALCRQPETTRRRADRHGVVRVVDLLGIDHDHSCERHSAAKACRWCIRGLLCDDCNRLLGFAERKPAVAVRFTDYLGLRPLLAGGG